ncbi:MAG: RimJ/RimL family protein N-acetyltransferase [Paracoccaceae bacterium]|jgi:RimJ/RimL family protein N-acetyltransferase
MTQIPTLETQRLTLRPPQMSDFDAYADFRASPRSVGVGGPYTSGQSFGQLGELIGHWSLRGFGRWMVADRSTDAPLGVVGLMYPTDWPEPEIAWSVFAAAEGKGIAQEAAQATRSYAYDVLGWTTVISCIVPDNTRSITLAQRMGAIQEPGFRHPEHGEMQVWRHLSPDQIATQIPGGGIKAYS